MALVCVEALDDHSAAEASELGRTLGLPMISQGASTTLKIVVSSAGLGLGFVEAKRGKPYYVDFLTRNWKTRLRQGLPKSHIFRRAVGPMTADMRLVDATAGFGQDSVLALALGCQVVALERSPVVAAVLKDGVLRAMREDEAMRSFFERLNVVEADALTYLRHLPPPEVIYLDPMFEKPKKSAKSPKEMQLLQVLLSEQAPNEEELFAVAMGVAKNRVVVKRPLKGKALFKEPSHMFKGQSIRFDVYLKS